MSQHAREWAYIAGLFLVALGGAVLIALDSIWGLSLGGAGFALCIAFNQGGPEGG